MAIARGHTEIRPRGLCGPERGELGAHASETPRAANFIPLNSFWTSDRFPAERYRSLQIAGRTCRLVQCCHGEGTHQRPVLPGTGRVLGGQHHGDAATAHRVPRAVLDAIGNGSPIPDPKLRALRGR